MEPMVERTAHKEDKRILFIAGFKSDRMYMTPSEWGSRSRPATPDPFDGAMSKRKWERQAHEWKKAHRKRHSTVVAAFLDDPHLSSIGDNYLKYKTDPSSSSTRYHGPRSER